LIFVIIKLSHGKGQVIIMFRIFNYDVRVTAVKKIKFLLRMTFEPLNLSKSQDYVRKVRLWFNPIFKGSKIEKVDSEKRKEYSL